MDHFNAKKFYEEKAARLTKVRDALRQAEGDLVCLRHDEERAPGGEVDELNGIHSSVCTLETEVSHLLDAVKAMLT